METSQVRLNLPIKVKEDLRQMAKDKRRGLKPFLETILIEYATPMPAVDEVISELRMRNEEKRKSKGNE